MPRKLSDDLNVLKIRDNISNSEIELYYRMPTTKEAIRYTNSVIRRERNKLVSRMGETRQKYGGGILMGIRDGDFEKKVDGGYVPISSEAGSEHYDPEWKAHILTHAPDLIEMLAVHVFEASVEEEPDEELEKN